MNILDIEKIRKETPGVKHVIHFNNAGSSLQPQQVVDVVKDYVDQEAQIGGYEALAKNSKVMDDVYVNMARYINCKPDEIAIVNSATTAWTQAFFGFQFKAGDLILTTQSEYGSNYIAFLQCKNRCGIEIKIVPENDCGDVIIDELEEMIQQQKPKLIAATHIPTGSGKVFNVEQLGEVASKHDIWYLVDACQSVGQMPLDVQKIKCDFLSGTSRKYLRGPRGIGFLYASPKALGYHEAAVLDVWGSQWSQTDRYYKDPTAKSYEQYEINYAAKAGFGEALKYYLEVGPANIWERIQYLSQLLRKELSSIPKVTVQDQGKVLCGIVTFSVATCDCQDMEKWLSSKHINVSQTKISSTRIDYAKRNLTVNLRASIHYYNNEDEIKYFTQTLQSLIQKS